MNELNAIAVNDKIIAKVILEENKTEGGIIVPEVAQGQLRPQGLGEVISVGELVREIGVGDIIMFHKQGGMDVLLGRKICKILKYDEVYGIMSKKEGE